MKLAELITPAVRTLTPYAPGKPLAELEREYGISGAIKLASNENPLGPSPLALDAIRAALPELALYPDSHGFYLKHALARHLGVDAGQITLGNGSNEVLELLARAFIAPGDEVIVPQYAFAIFAIVSHAAGARVVTVPARDYGADLDAMAAAVTPRTRLVFVANPNNPTGTWLRGGVLRNFLEALPAHVVAVLDEAYFEYVTDEPDYPNGLAWLAAMPRLVVTRTFSKVYGLAGVRVGYGVSSAELAGYLNRVRESFNVNSLGLAAAQAALGDGAHLARTLEVNAAGRIQLESGLRALGLDWIPSVGNFLTVATGHRSALEIYEALLRAGVIVRPLGPYGMPGHLRITIGTAAENARLLAALPGALG